MESKITMQSNEGATWRRKGEKMRRGGGVIEGRRMGKGRGGRVRSI